MGASVCSTVGTATDADRDAPHRSSSRLGKPYRRAVERVRVQCVPSVREGVFGARHGSARPAPKTGARDTRLGGMCRAARMSVVENVDICALTTADLEVPPRRGGEGAGASPPTAVEDVEAAGPDLDKPIRGTRRRELHLLLHQEPIKVKVVAEPHHEGALFRGSRSRLSKDVDAMQPACGPSSRARRHRSPPAPTLRGRRLSEAARSSKIGGVKIADACAMQITDLAAWVRGPTRPRSRRC